MFPELRDPLAYQFGCTRALEIPFYSRKEDKFPSCMGLHGRLWGGMFLTQTAAGC